MSLTTRVLPASEWMRLTESDLPALLPYVHADDTQVVVVEEGDRIVACWAVLRVTHVEGLWIAPAYRGHVSVARRLWRATMAIARPWAHGWVWTGADAPDIAAMLVQAGAVRIPMETFVLPLKGDA